MFLSGSLRGPRQEVVNYVQVQPDIMRSGTRMETLERMETLDF